MVFAIVCVVVSLWVCVCVCVFVVVLGSVCICEYLFPKQCLQLRVCEAVCVCVP